jgi:sarcosine oxidase subunit gamma
MSAAVRRSPLSDWHSLHTREWGVRESMPTPVSYHEPLADDAPVRLQDVSWRRRFGCKGPEAGRWLKAEGLSVPEPANSWAVDAQGNLVARLATSEFLVEALGDEHRRIDMLRALLPANDVYPVIRQDVAFVLQGKRARDLLLQTCSFNFDTLPLTADRSGTAVLTSMVGVGVTVIPRIVGMVREYRIWCDPSFGLYLWSTLVGIAKEMGGGAIANGQQSTTASRGESKW